MTDRMELSARLQGFIDSRDRAPSQLEIRTFVEGMSVEDRTRFLCVVFLEAFTGFTRPRKTFSA